MGQNHKQVTCYKMASEQNYQTYKIRHQTAQDYLTNLCSIRYDFRYE